MGSERERDSKEAGEMAGLPGVTVPDADFMLTGATNGEAADSETIRNDRAGGSIGSRDSLEKPESKSARSLLFPLDL